MNVGREPLRRCCRGSFSSPGRFVRGWAVVIEQYLPDESGEGVSCFGVALQAERGDFIIATRSALNSRGVAAEQFCAFE
jgi:hypothetical protein